MQKRAKQMLSLLLALTMVLALASCGKTGGASTSGEDGQITLTIGAPAKTNVTEWNNNKLTLWLEEQTGYNLEFVNFAASGGDLKTQFATMTAANEKLPDIMYYFNFSAEERNQYGRDGYFFDLATYFDDDKAMDRFAEKVGYDYREMLAKNVDPAQVTAAYVQGRDTEGHWYGFPSIGSAETSQARNQLYINQVWLDKVGMEVPTTFDELVEVLRAFKTQDPNGNGISDEIPMVGTANIARGDIPSWLINQYIYTNPTHHFNLDEEGNLYLPYDQDEYREGLKACAQLYDEGLLSTLTWTLKAEELPAMFTPADGVAKCGVWAGHAKLRVTNDNPVLYEYVPLLPLEGSYAALEQKEVYFYTFISADCEHPEAAFEVLLTLASRDGTIRQQNGAEGEDWEWGNDYLTGEKGIHVLNSDAYSGQTDSTWSNLGCTTSWVSEDGDGKDIGPGHKIQVTAPATGEISWGEFRDELIENHAKGYNAIAAERNPENLFYKANAIMTAEEQEATSMIKTQVESYVSESRAKFIAGELDIHDDAVWENYCQTIKKMGADTWIKVTQTAYDRSMGN